MSLNGSIFYNQFILNKRGHFTFFVHESLTGFGLNIFEVFFKISQGKIKCLQGVFVWQMIKPFHNVSRKEIWQHKDEGCRLIHLVVSFSPHDALSQFANLLTFQIFLNKF